jgi:GT2 family glycosyltransferase
MDAMSEKKGTTAVVPCWNESWDHILPTLQALESQSAAIEKVILVDDASPTPLAIPTSDPRVIITRNPTNLGISGSRNRGASLAETEFILFINCGITLPPTWHEVVLSHMQAHPKAVLASTRVVSHTPTELFTRWRFRFIENTLTRTRGTRSVPWLMGHVTLARKRLFLEIGGFNPSFRVSREDGEIGDRIGRLGYEIWQVDGPDAVCHQENTLQLMAQKAIRNKGWSLSKQKYPGADLRTFDAKKALRDQDSFLVSSLVRNLGKGRFDLAWASLAIWLRARKLIREADRKS